MKTKEEAMAMSPVPTATIKIDGWCHARYCPNCGAEVVE